MDTYPKKGGFDERMDIFVFFALIIVAFFKYGFPHFAEIIKQIKK